MKRLIRTRNIIIGAVVLAASIGIGYSLMQSALAEVTYESVEIGTVVRTVEEDAAVKSRLERKMSPLVSGQVERVEVTPGDIVSPGDVLLTLDSESAKLRLSAAKEQLSSLKFAMEEALKPADRNRVRGAESARNAAYTTYKAAKDQFEKDKALYEAGVISKSAYEASDQNRQVTLQAYNQSVSSLELARETLSDELKNKYLSDIEAQEAVVKELELQVDHHTVRASIGGTITEKYVNEGDYLMVGTPVVEIVNVDQLYMESQVLDSDVRDFHEGMAVRIFLEDEQSYVNGTVSKIHPKAYSRMSDLGIEQKRVLVEIEADALGNVRLGEELDVAFVTGMEDQVVRVPEELTFRENGNVFVFVNDQQVITQRQIEIGLEGESYIQVLDGLEKGEKIIVPTDDIEPGMKIK